MIEFVRGKVHARENGRLVVDIGALGLAVDVPVSVSMEAPAPGQEIHLHTHLLVREDALQLVGFSSDTQKRMFQALTSVSGIGPKVALKVLGEIDPGELAAAIVRGDVTRLTRLPGVGKKTAEVLVAHLRDAMGKSAGAHKGSPARLAVLPAGPPSASNDAILALQALGVDPLRARTAVTAAAESMEGADTSLLVGEALRRL
ncbi:MAG TPA: Holliday junction branch migration protein RuvA [Fibrobacteria bacterium]|nr:Holliday junction branch migration protein RuvA [Fibrobacteria bacterium]